MAADNIIILGSPLSGKSTRARNLIEREPSYAYFSVRKHFEPLRGQDGGPALPPLGSLLPEVLVVEAVQPVLESGVRGTGFLLDGFPGTVGQVQYLSRWLAAVDHVARILWLEVPKELAAARSRDRRVCTVCDGGVDPARAANVDSGCCAHCATPLSRRADDSNAGFENRWRRYLAGRAELLAALRAAQPMRFVD